MKLSKVVINNFCSCASTTLSLSDFNPIVGYNNSGKSNILRAIEWALHKSSLTTHSFFDPQQPVTVEGIIENVNLALLPGNQQQALAPYINNGSLHFRRRQDAPSCPVAQIRIDVHDPATGAWIANPNGIDNAIAVLFPEPLYIQAMEDAEEDVGKFAAKNTMGLLLKEVQRRINANNAGAMNAINDALGAVRTQFNGPNRMAELNDFEQDATNAISEFFPGLKLHVSFTTPGLEELFKSSTVTLSDTHGAPRPFANFGHGAQRSAHMALIKLLADVTGPGAAGGGGTVVLMIDEPELYLHPQAVELLRESLHQLSKNGFQVIFSTHSPLLVGTAHALQTQMIYKDVDGKTTIRQKLGSASTSFQALAHHAEAVFSIQVATHLLFSERVLIVEGKTEQMLLPQIYKASRGHSYAHDKGCLVPASGSSAVVPMMRILKAVGYEPKAVVDLDFAFKNAAAAGLNPPAQAITNCVTWFANNANALNFFLDASGLPTRKGPNGAVSALSPEECFEQMAAAMPSDVQQIATSLQPEGFWLWTKGAIEAHLGIQKNDAARISFLGTVAQNGNLNHATDAQALINLANWL